jgi:hypothetical protein
VSGSLNRSPGERNRHRKKALAHHPPRKGVRKMVERERLYIAELSRDAVIADRVFENRR